MTRTATHFSRYEYKYLLTEAQVDQLLGTIGPYIELDPFAASAGGRYEISSLYLDNDQFRLAGETLEGLRDRFKLRIRAYSDDPADPVFFEVKRRRDGRINKDRCRVERGEYLRLLERGSATSLIPGEQGLLDGFLARMIQVHAVPKVLVRYERAAFRGVFDHDIRITFDRTLQTARCLTPGPFFARRGWLPIEDKKIILEFKFNNRYPPWMVRAAQSIKLNRISYSKYATAATLAFDPASQEAAL